MLVNNLFKAYGGEKFWRQKEKILQAIWAILKKITVLLMVPEKL